jgi:hypothetical protein
MKPQSRTLSLVAALTALALSTPTLAQCENGKPLPLDQAASDQFGRVLAVSGDTLVAGAHLDDDAGTSSGSAYVFDASGLNWTQAAKLVATDGASSDNFGSAVAIDGTTIVVGSPKDDDKGSSSGSAYVFERVSGLWVQTAKLVPNDGGASDQFGFSVGVSGNEIVVGSFNDDDGGSNAGAAYVFTKQGSFWVESAKLIPSDPGASDNFGRAVAIANGVVLIGAVNEDQKGTNAGAAYVFAKSGPSWVQSQKLLASDGAASDNFGVSVSIAGDTIAIGAYQDDDKGSSSGSAYVFEGGPGSFVQTAKLVAPDGAASDWFGFSVDVSGDMDSILVGAYQDDDNGSNSGSAYLFPRITGSFGSSSKLIASDGIANDNFGFGVTLDVDRVLVGGSLADPAGSSSGAVWSFSGSGLMCPTFTAAPDSISLGSGGTQTLTLAPGPGWEDQWYWVLGSVSGTTPGIMLGTTQIPLNFDAYLNFTAFQPNQGPFVNTLGTLDGSAQATAQITIAAGTDPTLAGLHVDHCYIIWSPFTGSIDFASNSKGLDLKL